MFALSPQIESLEARRFLSGAHLDESFGVHGAVELPSIDSLTTPMAIQTDGKILLATASANKVRRLKASGSADRSYSGNGTATVGMGIHAIALQKDGKLVVAGIGGAKGDSPGDYHLAVSRLTKTGEIEAAFGDHGIAVLSALTQSEALSIALRNGRIVVAGRTNNHDCVVVVLTLDGADRSFSKDGIATIARDAQATAVSVAKDGSLTILVEPVGVGGTRVVRLTRIGAMDSRFSEDGVSPLIRLDSNSLFSNGDGSLVVVGVSAAKQVGTLVRITKAGKIDHSFGKSGYEAILEGKFAGPTAIVSPSGARYLFGSTGSTIDSDNSHIFVARLLADSKIDTSFGAAGFLTIAPHSHDVAYDAAFVPTGDKLVIDGGGFADTPFTSSSELIRAVV